MTSEFKSSSYRLAKRRQFYFSLYEIEKFAIEEIARRLQVTLGRKVITGELVALAVRERWPEVWKIAEEQYGAALRAELPPEGTAMSAEQVAAADLAAEERVQAEDDEWRVSMGLLPKKQMEELISSVPQRDIKYPKVRDDDDD